MLPIIFVNWVKASPKLATEMLGLSSERLPLSRAKITYSIAAHGK
jgi:hypothetical protein